MFLNEVPSLCLTDFNLLCVHPVYTRLREAPLCFAEYEAGDVRVQLDRAA